MANLRRCAVILARAGSKGIPGKNMLPFREKPLVVHPVLAAKESGMFNDCDIYVLTDCPNVKQAVELHSKASVLDRPANISHDLATDLDTLTYFVRDCMFAKYDYVVHLRATYPTIKPATIAEAIGLFEDDYEIHDSLRSVVRATQSPFKMWTLCPQKYLLKPLSGLGLESQPRQLLPPVYWQNAAIDIVKVSTVLGLESMTGDRVMPYIMHEDGIDIDTLADYAELLSNEKKQ